MNDRPVTNAREPSTELTRRRLLRETGVLTGVGCLAGCLDDVVEGTDPDSGGIGGDGTDQGAAADRYERAREDVITYEQAIHERINEVRETHDLEGLEFNEAIATVARSHSADMADNDYFAHVSPDGEGPDDRLDDFFPGHCRGIGENIAAVSMPLNEAPGAVAERVVSGWMGSPPHRENVLREAFDEQGIGVAISENDRVYATQNFCAVTGTGGWPLDDRLPPLVVTRDEPSEIHATASLTSRNAP